MQHLVKILDRHFEYVSHSLDDEYLILHVRSNRDTAVCPYCGASSGRVHSTRKRVFQDLPIMEHKTRVILEQRKLFCDNPACAHKTFSERFDCFEPYARKTRRLCNRIVDVSLGTSTITAAQVLRNGICDVGRETIGKLQKKNET